MRTRLMFSWLPDFLELYSDDQYVQILEEIPSLSTLMESAEWLDFIPPHLCRRETYMVPPSRRTSSHPQRARLSETIELPDTLPAIKDKALSILATLPENDDKIAEKTALLIRLASDPIWREYYRNSQETKGGIAFVHSATFYGIGLAHTVRLTIEEIWRHIDENGCGAGLSEEEADELINYLSGKSLKPQPAAPQNPEARQDLAVRYIFHQAYLTALADSSVLTEPEFSHYVKERYHIYDQLLEAAKKLRSFGLERQASELARIARACNPSLSNNTDLDNRWIVTRNRTAGRVRAYVFTLATSRRKISELWAYARIAFSAENCKVERIWH
jgi:hypothetical protein